MDNINLIKGKLYQIKTRGKFVLFQIHTIQLEVDDIATLTEGDVILFLESAKNKLWWKRVVFKDLVGWVGIRANDLQEVTCE